MNTDVTQIKNNKMDFDEVGVQALEPEYGYTNYSTIQLQDIISKYTKLLAIQYVGKKKARATIASWVLNLLTSVGTINTVAYNGFNLATARGVLLDNIGKIVGVDRKYSGDYVSSIGNGQQLYDESFKTLIAAKIVSNYNACTYESTARGIYELYKGVVFFDSDSNMAMTLYVPNKATADLIDIAIQKYSFLIAVGVQINYIAVVLPVFAFLNYFLVENPEYISSDITGFSNYLDFNVKTGNILTYTDILNSA
jgi:hypothetical protein